MNNHLLLQQLWTTLLIHCESGFLIQWDYHWSYLLYNVGSNNMSRYPKFCLTTCFFCYGSEGQQHQYTSCSLPYRYVVIHQRNCRIYCFQMPLNQADNIVLLVATYRFPTTAVSTTIDLSIQANRRGMILHPVMNGSSYLVADSYIIFSNLPTPLWISLQYNSEHCQLPPFTASTWDDRKLAFLKDNCSAPSEAILNGQVYRSNFITFKIPAGSFIPVFNFSYHG